MKHNERTNLSFPHFFREADRPLMEELWKASSTKDKKRAKELAKGVRAAELATAHNGSGGVMSDFIREFFKEYNSRIRSHGYDRFPSSFNVCEAFFELDSLPLVARAKEEIEHELDAEDFWDFVTSPGETLDFAEAAGRMIEGRIYSYDFRNYADWSLSGSGNQHFLVRGVSMIRHESEVSFAIEAGRTLSEDRLQGDALDNPMVTPGRERVTMGFDKRPMTPVRLPGVEGFQRVLALYRVDFSTNEESVKYLMPDMGSAYMTATNDQVILDHVQNEMPDIPFSEFALHVQSEIDLARPLFDAVQLLVCLPVLFERRSSEVDLVGVKSGLVNWLNGSGKWAREYVLARERVFQRSRLVLTRREDSHDTRSVQEGAFAIPLLSQASGFYVPIHPLEYGIDRSGRRVQGRTWRTLKEATERAERAFLTFHSRRVSRTISGISGGYLYVMRSSSHGDDVFKIGLTGRDVKTRASELSRETGVPTPLLVVTHWWFEDVHAAERIVHDALGQHRIGLNREFFKVALTEIIAVVNDVHRMFAIAEEQQ